jgi:hypothetical protein
MAAYSNNTELILFQLFRKPKLGFPDCMFSYLKHKLYLGKRLTFETHDFVTKTTSIRLKNHLFTHNIKHSATTSTLME